MWWMMSALHQKRPHRNLEQIGGLDWKMGSSRSISKWLAVKTKSLLSRIYHFQCIWMATHFETQTCSSVGPHLGNTFWGKALSRTGWPRKQYHYTTCLFLHDFGCYSMSYTPFRTPANVADWKRCHFWINTSSDLGLPLSSTIKLIRNAPVFTRWFSHHYQNDYTYRTIRDINKLQTIASPSNFSWRYFLFWGMLKNTHLRGF